MEPENLLRLPLKIPELPILHVQDRFKESGRKTELEAYITT